MERPYLPLPISNGYEDIVLIGLNHLRSLLFSWGGKAYMASSSMLSCVLIVVHPRLGTAGGLLQVYRSLAL
jgi:hypothetical protein